MQFPSRNLPLIFICLTFLFLFNSEIRGASALTRFNTNNATVLCGTFTPTLWINAGNTDMNTLNFGAPLALFYFGVPVFTGCQPTSAQGTGGQELSFQYYNGPGNNTNLLVTSTVCNNTSFANFTNSYIPHFDFAVVDETNGIEAGAIGNFSFKFRYDHKWRVVASRITSEKTTEISDSLISGPTVGTKKISVIETMQQEQEERRRMGIPLIADLLRLQQLINADNHGISHQKIVYKYHDPKLEEQATRSTTIIRGLRNTDSTSHHIYETNEAGLITSINTTVTSQIGIKVKTVSEIFYDQETSQVMYFLTGPAGGPFINESYTYDAAGRLTSIQILGSQSTTFVYNDAGQITFASLGFILGNWTFQY